MGLPVAHGSPASECAFAAPAAADLRCQFVAHLDPRLDGGHSCRGAAPRDRRPPRLVGRARPCPRAMRQPSRGAPAHRGRRRAAQRPSWRRPAGRGARQRRPPSAPRGGARRRSPQPPRLRQLDERRYRAPGRVRIHSRKVGAPLDSRSRVGWEWRRGPSAARAWQPGRRSSPRRRRRAP